MQIFLYASMDLESSENSIQCFGLSKYIPSRVNHDSVSVILNTIVGVVADKAHTSNSQTLGVRIQDIGKTLQFYFFLSPCLPRCSGFWKESYVEYLSCEIFFQLMQHLPADSLNWDNYGESHPGSPCPGLLYKYSLFSDAFSK